MSIIISFL